MPGKDRRPTELPPQGLGAMDLYEFMAALDQERPTHLAPIVDVLTEASKGKSLRVVIAAPRQHGKSTLIMHAIPWMLLRRPETPIAYATYGQQFAGKQSREMRAIAHRAGVRMRDDFKTIQEWRTERDGGLLATSVDGQLTGHAVRIGIVDDPLKNREEAENAERRELVWRWLRADLLGCVGPSGSVFIVASRYHSDDLSGRAVKELGWDYIRLPAICDDETTDPLHRRLGEALCEWGPDPDEPRTAAFLASKRAEIGEFEWHALMQGSPQPRSGSLFHGAHHYRELPP